jgi:hypothetical protein
MSSFLGLRLRISLAAALAVAAAPFAVSAPAAAQPVAAQPGGAVAPGSGNVVARYAQALGTANARLPLAVRRDLAERLLLLSSYYKIDPSLLAALVTVESAWRSRAVSPVGALGYGQLMPGTAAGLQVDALEPYENLDGTARYLRRMLNRFAGHDRQTRMQLALASYNAGAGAVDRYHGIPPYRETRAYVANVLRTRATFVASVGAHAGSDIGSLLARTAPSPRRITLRQAQGDIVARHHRQAERFAVAATSRSRSHRTAYVEAMDPNFDTLASPPPVRYETSHSFVARFLGLRHRVTAPSSSAPAAAATAAGANAPSTDF